VSTEPLAQHVISGSEALADFRQGLTGPFAWNLLDSAGGRLLLQLPVGVGKTEWMIRIIQYALAQGECDLVIVLVPLWAILREIRTLLPRGLRPVVLSPRPSRRCGDLDGPWHLYEQAGCGALGRREICGACPRKFNCPWPGQYGARLRTARLILATQQHLIINPFFIAHLTQQTGAHNPLVLIDESNLLIRPTERVITAQDLDRYVQVLEPILAAKQRKPLAEVKYLELTRIFQRASSLDLREGEWCFPSLDSEWAADVQQLGRELFGDSFRFPGHELQHFGRSDIVSREQLPIGDVRFAAISNLGKRFIIFSGSMAKKLARYRLDPNYARPALTSPFESYRFEHPGTRWFNLASLEGAAKFFPGNHRRILDFFAQKIVRNIREGKRTLLVSRKKFIPLCRDYLVERLASLGMPGVRIVTGRWDRHDLEDPRTLALVNYGLAGVNRFQHIESVYCLNGYYVTAETVSQAVQDIEASAGRVPIEIDIRGKPPRRSARVLMPDARVPIMLRIVDEVLIQKEADVVLQAVGRVRPFTQAREVITFHAGELPGVKYTLEFLSLAPMRNYFQGQTPSQSAQASRAEQARRLKAMNKTNKTIAAELNVSVSTVKRYLKGREGS
jgi:hypothetical protein